MNPSDDVTGPGDSPESQPDESYPFFTSAQASRVRALLRAAFADLGVDTTIEPTHLQALDGRTFGFDNLMAFCRRAASEQEWPRIVDNHARQLHQTRRQDTEVPRMNLDELRSRTFVRLQSTDVQGVEHIPQAPFAPGIAQTLVVDLPDALRTLDAKDIERLGGWAEAHAAGIENLLAIDDIMFRELPSASPLPITYIYNDCDRDMAMHVGSLALILPEVIEKWSLPAAGPAGLFLSMPHRGALFMHVLCDENSLATLERMINLTLSQFESAPGAISPDVYWWAGRDYQRLTVTDVAARSVDVQITPEFQAALDLLAPPPQ